MLTNKRNNKRTIIFLVGPTAVGKTEIAARLAKKINAEIISCDSMQVYKGMDIGTQKPSLKLRKLVPHHMVDILSPAHQFSAADFRKRALKAVKAIHGKGRIPLVVGGTGLYMKSLIDGLFPSPPKDDRLRKKLYREAEKIGGGHLHGKLKKIDPYAADKIHPNDLKKIVRALEICYTTGKTVSELKTRTRPLTDEFDIELFGLMRPREELYKRIDERVDRMFAQGFLNEVKSLSGKRLSMTAGQAIGYKEAISFLRKQESKKLVPEKAGMDCRFRGNDNSKPYPADNMSALKELIKKSTRHYAKRQLTWFRNDNRIHWVEVRGAEKAEKTAEKIIALTANR